MPNRDVFAFEKSGLNGFLFAAVGTELNGSPLTILSTLARLGEDPWAVAASWARMSRAAAADALAACISQMPLRAHDLEAGPATAARLTVLLFADEALPNTAVATKPAMRPRLARSPLMVAAYIALALAFVCALAIGARWQGGIFPTTAQPAQGH